MNRLKYALALMISASTASVSFADELPDYDAMYSTCVDGFPRINNFVVTVCSGDTREAADKEISVLIEQAVSQLAAEDPEYQQKFLSSQAIWEQYRDVQCDLATRYVGMPMLRFCPMQHSIGRVYELRELVGLY